MATDTEVELLRAVHYAARGVMRYNGVDATRATEYFDQLKQAVWAVNDYNDNHDDDDEYRGG